MNPNSPTITMREETDPVENAKSRAQMEKFDRNYAWLEANAAEVFSHRGKYICIAGQQLFVGDDIVELLAKAKTAHPEDDGPFFKYVPKERLPRIYGNLRRVASL